MKFTRYVTLGDSQTEGIGDGDEIGGYRGWVAAFAGPWLYRRLRGVSSGDGRAAERPDLSPVRPRTNAPREQRPG